MRGYPTFGQLPTSVSRMRAHSISSPPPPTDPQWVRPIPIPPLGIARCHCYSINFLALRGHSQANRVFSL